MPVADFLVYGTVKSVLDLKDIHHSLNDKGLSILSCVRQVELLHLARLSVMLSLYPGARGDNH